MSDFVAEVPVKYLREYADLLVIKDTGPTMRLAIAQQKAILRERIANSVLADYLADHGVDPWGDE